MTGVQTCALPISLALPAVAALAQREGVQVGPRSTFESLVPAAEIESQAARGYADMLAQARNARRLLPPDQVQVRRLTMISTVIPEIAYTRDQSHPLD